MMHVGLMSCVLQSSLSKSCAPCTTTSRLDAVADDAIPHQRPHPHLSTPHLPNTRFTLSAAMQRTTPWAHLAEYVPGPLPRARYSTGQETLSEHSAGFMQCHWAEMKPLYRMHNSHRCIVKDRFHLARPIDCPVPDATMAYTTHRSNEQVIASFWRRILASRTFPIVEAKTFDDAFTTSAYKKTLLISHGTLLVRHLQLASSKTASIPFFNSNHPLSTLPTCLEACQ